MPLINPGNGSTLIVHPVRLTSWAGQARDAAADLANTPGLLVTGGAMAGAMSCAFQSSGAAATACQAWSSVLSDLHGAVSGFGDKLVAAAAAYQKHDVGGADLFAPPDDERPR